MEKLLNKQPIQGSSQQNSQQTAQSEQISPQTSISQQPNQNNQTQIHAEKK